MGLNDGRWKKEEGRRMKEVKCISGYVAVMLDYKVFINSYK